MADPQKAKLSTSTKHFFMLWATIGFFFCIYSVMSFVDAHTPQESDSLMALFVTGAVLALMEGLWLIHKMTVEAVRKLLADPTKNSFRKPHEATGPEQKRDPA